MDSEPIRDKLDLKKPNQTKQEMTKGQKDKRTKGGEGKQTIERVVCGVVWYGAGLCSESLTCVRWVVVCVVVTRKRDGDTVSIERS